MTLPIDDPRTPVQAPLQKAEPIGRVISVRGSQASVGLPPASPQSPESARATVGKFLGVRAGKSLLVGLIADVSLRAEQLLHDHEHVAVAQIDLIGEILDNETAAARFQRGVTNYPAIGDPVTVIGSRELRLIFQSSGSRTIEVGHLQQDSSIVRAPRSRRNAEQAFRRARHHRRRQIERGHALAAADPGGAHRPSRSASRRAQRIQPLLRHAGAGAQSEQHQAAVLALQFRRDRRRVLRRPARP